GRGVESPASAERGPGIRSRRLSLPAIVYTLYTALPKHSLRQYLLEKMKSWINSLLEGERDEFLGRGRHQPLDPEHDNYRNGYRGRRINFFGLGGIELRAPRDRQGEFESEWLPERDWQAAEF